jgi:hypothetical protein
MGDKTAGFVLITPAWRELQAETMYAIWQAAAAGIPFGWQPQVGDALIGRARSIACTRFLLDIPTEYMIFVDSDIVFKPQDLADLFFDMRDKGYELIGGMYTVRLGRFLAHYPKDGKLPVDGAIREVQYLSTGFMGIQKSLLRKMVEGLQLPLCHPKSDMFKCYPFFENTAQWFEQDQQWIYESEDWDFCRKARSVGVTPYVDTAIQVGHKGEKVWTMADQPESTLRPPTKEEIAKFGLADKVKPFVQDRTGRPAKSKRIAR